MMTKIPKPLEELLQQEIDPAYSNRARLIFEAISHCKPSTILEVGCGRGYYLQSLTHFKFIKNITGIDINKEYLALANSEIKDGRVNILEASAYKLPFKNDSIECVICSEVLEHLDNEKLALAEINRVLKPNGTLLVTVPNYNFPFLWDPLNWLLIRFFDTHINKDIWWLAGIWAGHVRLYTKTELISLLLRSGFSIKNLVEVLLGVGPFPTLYFMGSVKI